MKHRKTKSLNIIVFPNKKTGFNTSTVPNTVYISTNYKTNLKFPNRSDSEKRRIEMSYLEDLYCKYANNLRKYLEKNREGLRLMGNEDLSKFPINYYFRNQRNQIKRILAKMKETKLSFISENNLDLKGKSFLTPLPYKSKQMVRSKVEKNELYLAERTAVMMRIYEYTHGRISNVAIEEYYYKDNEEKKFTLLQLKKVVNKIEDWWKGINEKRLKSIERNKFQKENEESNKQLYSKYIVTLNKNKTEKGIKKLISLIDKILYLDKKKLIFRLKKYITYKYLQYKTTKRNINNWFEEMKVSYYKNNDQSFTLINIKRPLLTIKNSEMFINKKFYMKCRRSTIVNIQRVIRKYIRKKERMKEKDLIVLKPFGSMCWLSKEYTVRLTPRMNLFKFLIEKKINFINRTDIEAKTRTKTNDCICTKDDTNTNANARINIHNGSDDAVYSNRWLRYCLREWKEISFKIKEHKAQINAFNIYKISLRFLLLSLSNITENNLRWSFNKLLKMKKGFDLLRKFNTLMKKIIKRQIVSSFETNIRDKKITKILNHFLTKRSLYNAFIHWKHLIFNVKYLSIVIRNYSIRLTEEVFFDHFSKINKNLVSTYTEKRTSEYSDDNEFKYYCFINNTKNVCDFVYLRVSMAIKIAFTLFIEVSNLNLVFRQIKHFKKKKAIPPTNPWEIIHLNPRLSSKLNQFKLSLQRIDYILVRQFANNFFHRIVLNHLVSALNINNEKLISLLKLGQDNMYQVVLNRILELDLTGNVRKHSDINLITYVQKYIAESAK